MRFGWLAYGIVILMAAEVLRVYFIMPFPGSQENETLAIAYGISQNIVFIRLVGFLLLIYPMLNLVRHGSKFSKGAFLIFAIAYVVIFYFFNYRFLADKMFLNLDNRIFSGVADNTIGLNQLVLGVAVGGESKAYPLEIIGYHHQVRDSIGGEPVMVTYCTVCRTGRVFSPIVDGRVEPFRLVGMDHYNAMFEDGATKSWWRQVTGEAIIGPLKGKKLNEVASEQMSLASWIGLHPETGILQSDSKFASKYKALEGYGRGTRLGKLERRDLISWSDKSWVLGIQIGAEARAYDWNTFQRMKVVTDEIGGEPIVLVANPDSVSFRAFSRVLDGDRIEFVLDSDREGLKDLRTGSAWNWNGQCEAGVYKGMVLIPVQVYQEYWHSWRTFHPLTTRYESN